MKPYIHKVQYYETDQMGIVHHSNYIRWMEESRIWYMEQLGWGLEKLEADGIVVPVVSVEAKYKISALFPDEVEIYLIPEEVRPVKLVFGYRMYRRSNGDLLFTGRSEHCLTRKDGGGIVRMKKECPELYAVMTEFKEQSEKSENA